MNDGFINKITNYIIIFVFFLLILCPLIDKAFVIDPTPATDNRAMRGVPNLPKKISELPRFFSEFDAYYRDQFGFRNSLIRGYNLLYYKIFGQSGNKRVIIGKKGWLYLTDNNSVDDYRKTANLTNHELESWKYILEKRQEWCRERNIDYLFVFAPSKHNIYPEYMPDWINRVGEQTVLDQLLAYLKDNSTVNILDLRSTLTKGKRQDKMYHTGDSHWTIGGAYRAYYEIISRLREKHPMLKPYAENEFKILKEGASGQDLASMLNLNPYYRKMNYKVKLETGQEVRTSTSNIKQSKYSVNNSSDQKPFSTTSSAGSIKAVMFRDSFLNSLYPYLAFHFSRAVYYWQGEFDKNVVEFEKPDVVIHEVAERFINRDTPIFEQKYRWALEKEKTKKKKLSKN